MDRNDAYQGAGLLMSFAGAIVVGISMGLGMNSWMVRRRFACGQRAPGGTALIDNVTKACVDVLSASNDLTMAAAAGGTIAFFAGIAVLAMLRGGEDGDA